MPQQDDILALLDQEEIITKKQNIDTEILEFSEEKNEVFIEEIDQCSEQEKKSVFKKTSSSFIFLIKYFSTSFVIFALLMLVSNYSAYSNIAYSFLFAEEMKNKKNKLINSVEASEISEESSSEKEVNTFQTTNTLEENEFNYSQDMHSISRLAAKSGNEVNLGIEITPYDNRVVIPKIGKNIPLVEIQDQNIEGMDELNNIFMEELENGVIRYPGSAKPGNKGNSFIFGHSSNLPWLNGDYNDVFALLDNVDYDDEVIVYYGQQKYIYKITTKEVISPGDVEVLQSRNQDLSEITLMTCWPIGTTYNRLVVMGELIKVE